MFQKKQKVNENEEIRHEMTLKEKEVRSYLRELPKGIETRKRQEVGLNGQHLAI